jgi:D-glycero-D-manno-heptose 1,7-bisphosphate phosphatase
MNKAVFLDRDGVINRKAPEGEYIVRWEDFEILAGVVEAVRALNQSGCRVIVVTNQRAIARKKITLAELEEMHARLIAALAEHGASIDRIYFCPHDIEANCDCRKPKPGMLLRALKDFEIDPRKSWMVGDSAIDIEAGKRAGCRTALIGTSSNATDGGAGADILAGDLRQAVALILAADESPALPPSRG